MDGEIITTIPQAIFFTVREDFEKPILIQKTLGDGISQNSDGSWTVSINASDTLSVKASITKTYKADVKIIDESGRNITIVAPTEFYVLPVVTIEGTEI